ncbi:hypothetical protein NBRC111894_1861 [Sporolactobacillus inulinus]|uniref:Uncharacterized protein n=1 Tax=Sporolactobacillus inulinus TaxID=2078 RepID=A0A4Y1ZB65_9BACL|nr:hypothetical protein NBRC111894_1861 [Sporolactobacillus inulinus]
MSHESHYVSKMSRIDDEEKKRKDAGTASVHICALSVRSAVTLL